MSQHLTKDIVIKWISINKSDPGKTREKILDGLNTQYSAFESNFSDKDLKEILDQLLSEKLIQTSISTGLIFTFQRESRSTSTQEVEYSIYETTLKGDQYVQTLPFTFEDYNKEILETLNLIIKYMPNYGPFDNYDMIIRRIPDSANPKIFSTYASNENVFVDVFDLLVDNGFAIERSDINPKAYTIELTGSGRWLKEKGTLKSYKKSLEIEQEKKDSEKIALAKLNEYQLNLAKRQFWINLTIAIGTSVAALYYVSELIKNHFNFSFEMLCFFIILIIGVIIGIVLSFIVKELYRKRV